MDTLELYSKLVSIPSVYPKEQKISAFIKNHLEKLGFAVKEVFTEKTRPNLVGTFGKSKNYLGFYGHMDTVEPDKLYTRDPFTMWTEKNGTIARGLGSNDMKGGITAILQTANYAVKNNLPMKVIFGVDEENISQGAHDLVDSGLLKNINFLVVAEGGQVKDVKQDFSLCYGRKGRIVFEIKVKGKVAHAAESEKGINAVEKAAQLIQELAKLSLPVHKKLGKTDIVVQYVSGESSSFSIPDNCTIRLSLLTNPLIKSEEFKKKILLLAKKLQINITIETVPRKTPYGESYEIPLDNSFLKSIEKKILKNYHVAPIYTPSVADENVFANRLQIPVLTLGAIGGGDHSKDEWLQLKSLDKVIEAYTKILHLYNV